MVHLKMQAEVFMIAQGLNPGLASEDYESRRTILYTSMELQLRAQLQWAKTVQDTTSRCLHANCRTHIHISLLLRLDTVASRPTVDISRSESHVSDDALVTKAVQRVYQRVSFPARSL
jgi:hypothetical protein